jgi:hypothetical protein
MPCPADAFTGASVDNWEFRNWLGLLRCAACRTSSPDSRASLVASSQTRRAPGAACARSAAAGRSRTSAVVLELIDRAGNVLASSTFGGPAASTGSGTMRAGASMDSRSHRPLEPRGPCRLVLRRVHNLPLPTPLHGGQDGLPVVPITKLLAYLVPGVWPSKSRAQSHANRSPVRVKLRERCPGRRKRGRPASSEPPVEGLPA